MDTKSNKDLSYVGLLDYLRVNSIYAPELARVINAVCNSSGCKKWGYLYKAIDVICPELSQRKFCMLLQSISIEAASVTDRAIRKGIQAVSIILDGDQASEEYKRCRNQIIRLRKSFRQICEIETPAIK